LKDVKKPRYVLIFVACIFIAVFLLISLRVISYGFIPNDDAMRHVAKAISGKDWTEILVLRPEITMDSHVGWHTILGFIHKTTGCDKDSLMVFSVVSLFFFFCIIPLFFLKRAEAWLISVLIVSVAGFPALSRIFLGRPLIFTMAVVVLLGFIWPRFKTKTIPWGPVITLTILIALATWIHCLWYMFALPVLCFFLAREWRAGFVVAICTMAGVLIGMMMTGQPIQFFYQTLGHLLHSLGDKTVSRQLVTEFQPFGGEIIMVIVVMAVLGWRAICKEWNVQAIMTPMFILALISWTLGFLVARVWTDWGVPALLVWMTFEFEEYLKKSMDSLSFKRVWLAAAVACVLFLSISSDNKSRWTQNIPIQYLSLDNPKHKEWLPEKGGIFYNTDMDIFYQTFYANPNADWRYILGFEPSMMPKEDLVVFRNIRFQRGSFQAHEPWVKKMRPEDRLVLTCSSFPQIKELQWYQAIPDTWIGRLPKKQ
jgi:hypothetical protein